MGQLLRNRQLGCGCSHWIAVRRCDAHCGQTPLRVAEAGAAFATPTIIHLGTALLLSALLVAPWATIVAPACLWSLVGVA